MNNPAYIKVIFFCSFIFFVSIVSWSQQCAVDIESIKGSYTGDCKKGKAHGRGKSAGVDVYEGEFKNGVPDGFGTYTWNNGDSFTGKYSKGLRDGRGVMTYKKQAGPDSVEGFWKKDVYIGKHEKPWHVHARSASVREVSVEFNPNPANRISVIITNTTGGVRGTDLEARPRFKVDNTQVSKGSFERMTSLESHLKSTETSFMDVSFPFRVKLIIAKEEVEIEFHEPGNYIVEIVINQ